MTEISAWVRALAITLSVALLGLPIAPAHAAPPARAEAPEPVPSGSAADSAAPSDSGDTRPAEPASVEAALEAGDLEVASELARRQREADPSAKNHRIEAEVAERRGDLARAEAAYRAELAALADDDPARARAQNDLARVQARARGTVPDEPKSTHRASLDEQWARAAPATKQKKRRAPPPPGPRPAGDRIVTKWYFWVTVGAIVASAAAVTAIAIRAARDDEPDALGLEAGPRAMGPTLLRF